MTSLYLPPHVQQRIDLERRRQYEAAVLRNCTVEDPRAREWTVKLQHVSPDLFMVRAHDKVELGVPLRPGFYHILVRNPDAPMTVMTVHENGRYAEPDSRIFDVLARGTLRERRVRARLAEQDREVQDAVEKERRTANEDRREKLRDVVKS